MERVDPEVLSSLHGPTRLTVVRTAWGLTFSLLQSRTPRKCILDGKWGVYRVREGLSLGICPFPLLNQLCKLTRAKSGSGILDMKPIIEIFHCFLPKGANGIDEWEVINLLDPPPAPLAQSKGNEGNEEGRCQGPTQSPAPPKLNN